MHVSGTINTHYDSDGAGLPLYAHQSLTTGLYLNVVYDKLLNVKLLKCK